MMEQTREGTERIIQFCELSSCNVHNIICQQFE